MIGIKKLLFLATFITLTCGCGSSGSNDGSDSSTFVGLWLSLFNIVIDDCSLLAEGESAFEDEHMVMIDNNSVMLEANQLPSTTYEGSLRGEDSFLVQNVIEGDIFANGINCTLTEELAYNSLKNNTAESVYTVRVLCADGSSCDTLARGSATKE